MKKKMDRQIFRKYKVFIDLFYSLCALGTMHGTLQIIVYPYLNKVWGTEEFGNIVSALGMVTIFAVSAGLAVNNIQLKTGDKAEKLFSFLYTVSILAVIGMILTLLFSYRMLSGVKDLFFLGAISLVTSYRSYGDVFYRICLNYKRYFIYYTILSFGYLAGLLALKLTGEWGIVFIFGEILALLYLTGTQLAQIKSKPFARSKDKEIFRSSLLLYISLLVYYVALNFDKIILLYMIDGNAVTEFYAASLMGKTFSLLIGSLNAIILSYLVKNKNGMSFKQLYIILVLTAVLGIGALGICLLFTPFITGILYPQVQNTVNSIYVVTNIAQVLCFMSSILLTVLLYLSNSKLQLMVQSIFTALLVLVSSICVYYGGIHGYSKATLIVYTAKLILVILLCFIKTKQNLAENKMG